MNWFRKLFSKRKVKDPEDDYEVTVTSEFVKVEHPDRKTEMIYWRDIRIIKFINTDKGPSSPDIWLALQGNESSCLIPHGAEGCGKVYDIVSKYKGFNFDNVFKSMSCKGNQEFLLWVKK